MSRIKIHHEGWGSTGLLLTTLLSVFLLFAMTSTALAQEPVTYNFTTDGPGFTGGCPACLFEGQPVTGTFVYRPAADLTTTNPQGFAVYLGGIAQWTGSVGGESFSDDLGLAIVGNDIVGGSRDLLGLQPGLFLQGFEIDGYTLVDVRMRWLEGIPGDPEGNPDFLLNQNLPAELPDFPGFLLLDFENPLGSGPLFTVNFQNLVVTHAPTTVMVDIKPGSSSNSVNPSSRGTTPVAVLTTDTFDATQVDPLSVRFGALEASEAHQRAHIEDVDDDGDADLVVHFNIQESGIECGDEDAALTGMTFSGEAITGSDTISTVGCPEPEFVTYDFAQTFGNVQVSGTLTFTGIIPASITAEDMNALATWNLNFSTVVPVGEPFPLEPFTLTNNDSSWTAGLLPDTTLQIDATSTELSFDLTTPFETNANLALMSNLPDNFSQFSFFQGNQPGFQGTGVFIQAVMDPSSEGYLLPFDAPLSFPAIPAGSAP